MQVVAFIDTSAHPTADNFYRSFPNEPIPPEKPARFVTVEKIVALPKMSLEALLEKITANVKKSGSVLTVSHGTDAAMLISIGPPKNNVKLGYDVLDLLERNRDGKESDRQTAERLKLKASGFAALKQAIEGIHKLELKRVDMRACRIGSNEFTMNRFRKFFNCQTLSAPILYDTFGPIPFGKIDSSQSTWSGWLQKHKKATVYGRSPNRFALDYIIGSKVMLSALAESRKAVDDWVAAHLPEGNYTKGPLHYHGVTDKSSIVFSGEPAFRANLAQAEKGQEPSMKIDLNDLEF